MNKILILVTEVTLSDGSCVYDITIDGENSAIITIATDMRQAVDMAQQLADTLTHITGLDYFITTAEI